MCPSSLPSNYHLHTSNPSPGLDRASLFTVLGPGHQRWTGHCAQVPAGAYVGMHRTGPESLAPEPSPRPPGVASSLRGSREVIPSGALHLATFLGESMGDLWGCFWPAPQSAPLLPQSLPRLRQPDQVLRKYTPSWVYLGLGIAGSVCSWLGS